MPGAVCQQNQIHAQIPKTCYVPIMLKAQPLIPRNKPIDTIILTRMPNMCLKNTCSQIPNTQYQKKIHNDDHNTVGDDNGDGDDDV